MLNRYKLSFFFWTFCKLKTMTPPSVWMCRLTQYFYGHPINFIPIKAMERMYDCDHFTDEDTSPKCSVLFHGPIEVKGRGGRAWTQVFRCLQLLPHMAARIQSTVSGHELSSQQSMWSCRLEQWVSELVSVTRGDSCNQFPGEVHAAGVGPYFETIQP